MPLHFLWGDEDFLIERHIEKLKQEILKGEINELNFKKVASPSFPLFSELIRTNSMMFGDTVVVIECQNYFLSSKNKKELDDKQTTELINAFQNIPDTVHIVLVCLTPRGEKKKPDSRKKLYKEILKLTKPIEFPSYKNYEEYKLIPIIKKIAQELKIQIHDKECSLLIQTTGSELRNLYSQLEKLKLYAYPETKITSKMIENITTNTTDVFSILDFVLKKDYVSALNLISQVLQKEHYLPSFALLQTMVNNLLKTKILALSDYSSFDIASKTKQNEFVVKKNLEKIQNISLNELTRLKINLATVDYLLKNGTIKEPELGYEIAFLSENLGEYL